MARHPQEPILFLIQVDGRDTVAVRAMTSAEARDWFIAHQVDITRPTPTEAFLLGQWGEVPIHDAKPEYALPLNPDQLPLLPGHSLAEHALRDATPLDGHPIDGDAPLNIPPR